MRGTGGEGGATAAPRPPIVEVTIRLFGWEPGESEIELTLPHDGHLDDAGRSGIALRLAGLRPRIERELADAFRTLPEASAP